MAVSWNPKKQPQKSFKYSLFQRLYCFCIFCFKCPWSINFSNTNIWPFLHPRWGWEARRQTGRRWCRRTHSRPAAKTGSRIHPDSKEPDQKTFNKFSRIKLLILMKISFFWHFVFPPPIAKNIFFAFTNSHHALEVMKVCRCIYY